MSSSSRGRNHFMPTPAADRRTQRDYDRGYYAAPFLPLAIEDANRDAHVPRRTVEERVMTGPPAFVGIPVPAPVEILILSGMARESPPRFMDQQNLQASTFAQHEDSRFTEDEQKKALSKLKKEIYNPGPKRLTSRLSLYYRDQASNVVRDRAKDHEDDSKRCAVCLDDFEPKEVVTTTPCSHMFHEECIVPWLKSHGQCPVCRYTISERTRASANVDNFTAAAANDAFAGELITVIRAMGEAFFIR